MRGRIGQHALFDQHIAIDLKGDTDKPLTTVG